MAALLFAATRNSSESQKLTWRCGAPSPCSTRRALHGRPQLAAVGGEPLRLYTLSHNYHLAKNVTHAEKSEHICSRLVTLVNHVILTIRAQHLSHLSQSEFFGKTFLKILLWIQGTLYSPPPLRFYYDVFYTVSDLNPCPWSRCIAFWICLQTIIFRHSGVHLHTACV